MEITIAGITLGFQLEDLKYLIIIAFVTSLISNIAIFGNSEGVVNVIGTRVLGYPECKTVLNICFAPSLKEIDSTYSSLSLINAPPNKDNLVEEGFKWIEFIFGSIGLIIIGFKLLIVLSFLYHSFSFLFNSLNWFYSV